LSQCDPISPLHVKLPEADADVQRLLQSGTVLRGMFQALPKYVALRAPQFGLRRDFDILRELYISAETPA